MRTLFPFLTLVPLLLVVASSATAQQACVEGSGLITGPLCPDDLIVLSTPGIGDSNALANGASNETIVFEESSFGEDEVMNFTTEVDN